MPLGSARLLSAVLLGVTGLALVPVRTASAAPGAARSLLLDGVVRADGAIVAVGERGAVLISDDQAASWRTLPSTVDAALTGVTFVDASLGWICGHGGVLLHTQDGGRSWQRQLRDEPGDTVFLDVVALSPQSAIAVGAFGTLRVTHDGGRSWERPASAGEDRHLNRILLERGGAVWIAVEGGLLMRSGDQGRTWQAVSVREDAPSLYGLLELPSSEVLVHGLRGHAWRVGRAEEVAAVDIEAPVMLATSCRLADGRVLLAGAARWFFISADDARTFTRASLPLTTGVAELLPLKDGRVLALGEAGATVLRLPAGSGTNPPSP
ncbi:MAG: hypothetical protein FJ382_12115 [Verrucomicrobia bacterium]|nr:hypothetical protein [Verrucomicrobiota bacterium]